MLNQRTIMGFVYIHKPKSVIEMDITCRLAVGDGRMSAGEHMCTRQNKWDNDMQLSEYSFVCLQIRTYHVAYLLESDVAHMCLCWWLENAYDL